MKHDENKRQYWEGKISAWLGSGLTQRAYCEREGLKRPTFDYWRRRLKPEASPVKRQSNDAAMEGMTLVPVQVERQADSASVILTSPGGWQVSVAASVDVERLSALLRCLP